MYGCGDAYMMSVSQRFLTAKILQQESEPAGDMLPQRIVVEPRMPYSCYIFRLGSLYCWLTLLDKYITN